jgi:hypothetical protein
MVTAAAGVTSGAALVTERGAAVAEGDGRSGGRGSEGADEHEVASSKVQTEVQRRMP